MILAGDIGGTKTRLALFDRGLRPRIRQTFRTHDHASLYHLVADFLDSTACDVSVACFAVAGTVTNGTFVGPNIPWSVHAHELAESLELPSVVVVNDVEANARGIESLGPNDFAVLNEGDPFARGNRAVVSAGTGLGEAGLYWNGARYHAVASEGGHADFAPRTDIEVALYRFLAAEFGHVSYERVLSGPGLENIYRFLGGDPSRDAAAISEEAGYDSLSIGAHALELFASIYGARAGNVALAFMATGGVFLGGGIAPKVTGTLANGAFMRAFLDKGRLSGLLREVPVSIILDDRTALYGAARIAAENAPPMPMRLAAAA
jgi:glucokinase